MNWTLVGERIVGYGGLCLDVRGPSTDDGTPVQMWRCNGLAEQTWTTIAAG